MDADRRETLEGLGVIVPPDRDPEEDMTQTGGMEYLEDLRAMTACLHDVPLPPGITHDSLARAVIARLSSRHGRLLITEDQWRIMDEIVESVRGQEEE